VGLQRLPLRTRRHDDCDVEIQGVTVPPQGTDEVRP
jgi:hypothetical protein